MVRNYVRKSNNNMYDVRTIIDALTALKKSNKSVTRVAKEYNMKSGSLSYHWRMYNNKENIDIEKIVYSQRYSCRIFSYTLENELLSYIIACANIYSTVSQSWVRQLAYELAVENKLVMPQNWKTNKIAGKDWWLSFKRRHKAAITQHDSGSKSLEQMMKAHKNKSNSFNTNYTKVLSKFKFQPKDVFILEQCKIRNVDASLVVDTNDEEQPIKKTKTPKNSTSKGKSTVTFVGTVSAIGQSIPPYYIFSFTRYRKHQLLQEAPKGSKAKSDPTGAMTKQIFVDYLKHVVDNVKCSNEEPVLLLLDDNNYYFSLGAVKLAKKHGIVILTFPPHTEDKLQHLEHSMFNCVKTELGTAKMKEGIMICDDDRQNVGQSELVGIKGK